MKKSWNEKLAHRGDLPKIEVTTRSMADIPEGARMLIAPADWYDEMEKKVPEGKVTTIPEIRKFLAKREKADFTCPLTAGIFTNIVANANEERDGKNPTAWWRTLKADGELNPKYPNFPDMQKQLLEQEGHTIIQKGKRYFVADFEKKLYNFS